MSLGRPHLVVVHVHDVLELQGELHGLTLLVARGKGKQTKVFIINVKTVWKLENSLKWKLNFSLQTEENVYYCKLNKCRDVLILLLKINSDLKRSRKSSAGIMLLTLCCDLWCQGDNCLFVFPALLLLISKSLFSIILT